VAQPAREVTSMAAASKDAILTWDFFIILASFFGWGDDKPSQSLNSIIESLEGFATFSGGM
jgi:hypothetical protein